MPTASLNGSKVVTAVPEEQRVTLEGASTETVALSFLGQSTTVTIGTSTLAEIQAGLEAFLMVSIQFSNTCAACARDWRWLGGGMERVSWDTDLVYRSMDVVRNPEAFLE